MSTNQRTIAAFVPVQAQTLKMLNLRLLITGYTYRYIALRQTNFSPLAGHAHPTPFSSLPYP